MIAAAHLAPRQERVLDRCNIPTTNCMFFLDTPRTFPQNPPNFSRGMCGKVLGVPCSIFPAGPCSASIRNARRAGSGCARTRYSLSSAPIAPLHCTACRRHWGRVCGCVRARWGRTGRRVHGARNLRLHARHCGRARGIARGKDVPAALAQYWRSGSKRNEGLRKTGGLLHLGAALKWLQPVSSMLE